MGKKPPLPILITGGGRRIGLAVAWHFLNQKQPVIVSYRTHYPAIDGLREAGAICIPADFSTDEGVLAFADEVKAQTDGLRALCTMPAPGSPKNPAHRLAKYCHV